jgi:drug/metabolite transporter (DMT)-like permease
MSIAKDSEEHGADRSPGGRFDTRALIALVLLGALWGGSFLLIKVSVPAFGPFALTDLRALVALLALLAWPKTLRAIPSMTPFRRRWRQYLLLGALDVAIPLVLVAAGELVLPASTAAILVSTVPVFTALIAVLWLRERLTTGRATGLLSGFVGVAILVGWSPVALNNIVALAIAAVLLAAVFYSLAGVYAGKFFEGVSAYEMAVGQQVSTVLLLFPLVLVAPPQDWTSGRAWACLIALGVLCTGLAYLLFFYLIRSVGPTRTMTVAYLVPLFGTAWGAMFLGEDLNLSMLLGMAVILLSVGLVTRLPVSK